MQSSLLDTVYFLFIEFNSFLYKCLAFKTPLSMQRNLYFVNLVDFQGKF